jgi:phospholipid transport system substrate-binding protein
MSNLAKRGHSFITVVQLCAVSIMLMLNAAHADDGRSPDQVVDNVAKQLLSDLEQHREQYRKDPAQLHKLIDKYFLTNFDTEYAARRVLAKHWRDATPDQRKQFIDAFYQSLINNYGDAILDFTADRMSILPYKGDPSDTNATVRSEIRRSNGTTVPVNYTLHKTEAGWKAWDVVIEGVSYVKSFQTDFGSEIDQKGLDAVIKRLQSQPASAGPSTKTKAH